MKVVSSVEPAAIIPTTPTVLSDYLATFQGLSAAAETFISFPITNLITNGNFVNTAGWLAQGANLSAASNMLTVENTGSVAYGHAYQDLADFTGATGKIINMQFEYMVTNALCTHVYAVNYNGTSSVFVYDKPTPTINTWYKVSVNFAMDSAWNGKTVRQYLRHAYANTATATGKIMKMQNVLTCDLTATFGAGNEPTAAEMEIIIELWQDGWFNGTVQLMNFKEFAIYMLNEIRGIKASL